RTLWVDTADGSGARRLSAAGAGVFHPMWARDGKHILFGRDDALWVIGVDDGQVQKVLGSFPGAANPLGFYGFTPYLSDVFSWRRKTHARL
ncbi:MAG: biopolymer transporter Tol, partial [Bacillota bacterium]